ncbi:hypothetical protein VUJ49_08970 [Pseudomonas berkeleyensis]|uniref:Uncharacterized protein n=1 Tax=Pseudomonas berkeleyensis TaxID=2726956 RepID=A0A7G5DTU2_9PSED|nr:hypothetical protein [Pseudomonas berkeleyensis]QMV65167.1 hypothetical protein HS968_08935 [Pseudomonas berkeleyensis]WSO40640.1 hypothetical protein VUJ49_08970 [Pseudomonas berkeleyensis]
MKPTIEELLLQIVSTVLIINQQGKWHAFVDLQGHVCAFCVRVCSADTNYQDTSHEVDRRTGYWHSEHQKQQACLSALTRTLTWLQGYLDMPATPTQEVAA